MKKILSLFLILTATSLCLGQVSPQKIDSILNSVSQANPTIGISVGIVSNGKQQFFNYGNTSRTNGKEVDEKAVFELGSITKLFTGYLIAELAESGKIDVNAPIDDYLPKRIQLNPEIKGIIKVSDLASHQSGLPDFDFMHLLSVSPEQPLSLITNEMVDSILVKASSVDSLGIYQYANLPFVLLGAIIEEQYGMSYENVLYKQLFKPLKMKSTFTSNFKSVKGKTIGYNALDEKRDYFNWNSTVAPAGLLKSCTKDVLKYIELLLDEDNEAINSYLKKTYFKNTYIETGLGLNILRLNGQTIFAKSGDTLGQSSVLGYNPEEQWGVIILTNQRSMTARETFDKLLEVL